jgi:alpha-L-fucosidase 2
VVRLTAEGASLSFTARLSRPERATVEKAGADTLAFRVTLSDGSGGDGMRAVALLRAVAEGGGTVTAGPDGLRVENARAATLLLAASTTYNGRDPEAEARLALVGAARRHYDDLRHTHETEHARLFGRVALTVGPSRDDLPTDARLARAREGKAADDLGVAALYFQYGRYLLLASSHPDSVLPAHLQGIWAEGVQNPWSCDYHHNINDQMNYLPAEATNLPECHRPFLNFIESLAKPGAKTAKVHYGVEDGWVVHTISNVWGYTSPGERASWGQFPAAAAWLCRHLWEHFEYGGDRAYLRSVYPTLAGAARFFLGFLAEDPVTRHLVTAPSNSPENAFRTADGWQGRVCMGPTMDSQILRDFFG